MRALTLLLLPATLTVTLTVACAESEAIDPLVPLGGGGGAGAGPTGGAGAGPTGGAATGGGDTGGMATGGGSLGGSPAGGTGGGASASCTDGIRNGTEGDVDCGGLCPVKCADGQRCDILVDCASGLACYGVQGTKTCSHCGNAVQDGDETGMDCGPTCGACLGEPCDASTPCAAPILCGASGTCSHCGNGAQDGDETGLDCGGSCLLCDGADCALPAECAIGDCYLALCQPTPCLAGWRDTTAGASCLNQTQSDFLECVNVLDCLLENACTPDSCGQTTCRPASGGMAGLDAARPVYTALCG